MKEIAGTIHHCDQRHSAGLDLDNLGILGGVLHRLAPRMAPSADSNAFQVATISSLPGLHPETGTGRPCLGRPRTSQPYTFPFPCSPSSWTVAPAVRGPRSEGLVIPYFIPSMGATVGDGQKRSATEAPGSEPVRDCQGRSETVLKRLLIHRFWVRNPGGAPRSTRSRALAITSP